MHSITVTFETSEEAEAFLAYLQYSELEFIDTCEMNNVEYNGMKVD